MNQIQLLSFQMRIGDDESVSYFPTSISPRILNLLNNVIFLINVIFIWQHMVLSIQIQTLTNTTLVFNIQQWFGKQVCY